MSKRLVEWYRKDTGVTIAEEKVYAAGSVAYAEQKAFELTVAEKVKVGWRIRGGEQGEHQSP